MSPAPVPNGHRRRGARGYIVVRMEGHPRAVNGFVREHILVVEAALGRYLSAKHPVHHVDENMSNNSRDNLVVCEDQRYHILLHMRQRAFDACGNPDWRPCHYCKAHDAAENMSASAPSGRMASPTYRHQRCHNSYKKNLRASRRAA